MNRNRAFELAIKALEKGRSNYSVGNNLYLSHGDNPPEFACRDRREYKRYTQAIAIMEQALVSDQREEERDRQQVEMSL